MNILQMTYFIAVVEHQNISRAAQSLFITQQTLSAHVAAMEKELGTCLFERRPKFRLTRSGERFYQYCLRFRELNYAMEREFCDMKGEISDILHVGISQTRSQILMPDLIQEMQKELPFVQVRIAEQTNDVLIEKLLKGDIDLMIGNIPDAGPKIYQEVLYRESMVLVLTEELLTKEQLAVLRSSTDLRVLAHLPFVMNTQNDIAGRIGSEILEAYHIMPRVAAMSDSAETCLRMCQNGLGAYICPDVYVRFYREWLRNLLIIPLDFSYPICLARRNDLYEKTSVQTFRKCCFKRVVE